ncbi:MAG TPA: PP2C family serine/threonine-protein phosphatase [Vicinamibacterales bacterium]|nr:PP2C family serine/threonine-protein phosphatase [Vicinamibacterales bacterium]
MISYAVVYADRGTSCALGRASMADDDLNLQWRSAISRPVDIEPFRPLSSTVSLEVAASSICGALRANNTDHYLAIRLGRMQETMLSSLRPADLPPRFEEFGYALLVADGLGDECSGARASRVALSALAHLAIRYGRWNVRVDADTIAEITEQGAFLYRRVHDAVLEASRSDEHLADMATSLSAMYVAGADLFFANVGHSKGFLFRDGGLFQLTTDHTIDPQKRDAAGHPLFGDTRTDFTHLVTKFVGSSPDLDVAIEHVDLLTGDRLVLCTNGLTDAVSLDEIAATLALQRRPEDDCQRLIELATRLRAADDVTVIVADYQLLY